MKDIKVTFSDIPHDFAAWVKEKTDNLLLELCDVIREVPEIREKSSFQSALDSGLKLFALAHGNLNGIRCGLIHSLLMQYNIEGYFFLKDLIYGSKNSTIMQKINHVERNGKILDLIESNDKSNRTALAELLEQSDLNNPWIALLYADLELVHNGTKAWDWFYKKHCNDRTEVNPMYYDELIRDVQEYFNSDDYRTADEL